MSDNFVTQFEDLPNELFRNVFDYLTIRDLYRTFVRLNKRIDAVARSVDHVSVKLWSSDSADDPAIAFFASRLVRLMVINDGCEKIDLTYFPNVRSLKLKYLSNNQMRQLLHSERLRHLEFLALGSIVDSSSSSSMVAKVHGHLFSNGFPCLHSCSLVDTPRPMSTWSTSAALSSLTLHGPVTLSTYTAILDACPGLSRLTLDAFRDDSADSTIVSSYHSLCFLSIRARRWTPNTMIDPLLLHVPKLEQLRIVILPPVSRVDFCQVASLLFDRTPRLDRFDCDMMVYKYTVDTDVVHQLHPCFVPIQCCYEYGRFHIFTSNSHKRCSTA